MAVKDATDIDLGVDPKKSTPVDSDVPSRVESIWPSATDPKSNLKIKVT